MPEVFDIGPKHKITILAKEITKNRKFINYHVLARADNDPRKFEVNFMITREMQRDALIDLSTLIDSTVSDGYDGLLSEEGQKGWIDD